MKTSLILDNNDNELISVNFFYELSKLYSKYCYFDINTRDFIIK
jgi:hypothetical protein